MKLVFCIALLSLQFPASAQMPAHRLSQWKYAGSTDTAFANRFVRAEDFKGPNFDGRLDSVLTAAIDHLSALGGGTVLIPAGDFYFSQPVLLKNHVRVKGAGKGTKIHLKFGSNAWNGFEIKGSALSSKLDFDSISGRTVHLRQALSDTSVNMFKLACNDTALMNDAWAYGAAGQLLKIRGVSGNRVTLEDSIDLRELSSLHPYLLPVKALHHTAIECLYIQRDDSADYQASSIYLDYAYNCHISGVESFKTNFAHICINRSAHCLTERNYLHHSFGYGGGGEGYGVVLQSGAYNNLVRDNVFVHLRHSVLLQSGANTNVVAYNSSVDPFVTDNVISDAGGDLVCHGNYPYRNLFEGNVCQTAIVDNSHGKNGHYNTFFRNRMELYGVIVSAGQDSQNFVANEVTNTGAFKGLFNLSGNGHYRASNAVRGSISDAQVNFPNSLYLSGLPDFWNIPYSYFRIGYPGAYLQGSNPARIRYKDSGDLSPCQVSLRTNSLHAPTVLTINIYPNPIAQGQTLYFSETASNVRIYSVYGQMILQDHEISCLETAALSKGIYLLFIDSISYRLIID